jgi:enamine deaminase RidA (YjgF/YER057c/UK114 family)
MDPVLPPNTPAGLAYTPGFVLHPESQIRPIGLISPKKNGVIRPTVAGQMQDCLSNVADALAAHGPNAKLVKVTRLMTDVRDVWPAQLVIDEHFGSRSILPTSTLIEVPACSEPGIRIEVDLWAEVPRMDQMDTGDSAGPGPRSILGFVNAGVGDASGKGAAAELNSALDAVPSRISAAGASLDYVVKLVIYLADMRLWPTCRDVALSRYSGRYPVVVPINVSKVLAEGACVEVEATFDAPPAMKDTSDVVTVYIDRRVVVVSGQPALPAFVGGMALDMYKYQPEASPVAQAQVSFRNLENVLEAAGSDWDHVFKTTWYITDVWEWPQIEEVARAFFGRPIPCPMVVEVPKLVMPAIRVQPDIWAVVAADR